MNALKYDLNHWSLIKKIFFRNEIALNCKNPQIGLAIKVTELAILYDFPLIFFNNLKKSLFNVLFWMILTFFQNHIF